MVKGTYTHRWGVIIAVGAVCCDVELDTGKRLPCNPEYMEPFFQVGDRVRYQGTTTHLVNLLAGLVGVVATSSPMNDGATVDFGVGVPCRVTYRNLSPEGAVSAVAVASAAPKRAEMCCPRPACGKKNDVGVRSCWNCGGAL